VKVLQEPVLASLSFDTRFDKFRTGFRRNVPFMGWFVGSLPKRVLRLSENVSNHVGRPFCGSVISKVAEGWKMAAPSRFSRASGGSK